MPRIDCTDSPSISSRLWSALRKWLIEQSLIWFRCIGTLYQGLVYRFAIKWWNAPSVTYL